MKDSFKLTRRKLGALLISTGALAQTPTTADPLQAARDRMKTASDALAKVEVPTDTEPAFQFRA